MCMYCSYLRLFSHLAHTLLCFSHNGAQLPWPAAFHCLAQPCTTQVLPPMEAHKWFQYWRKCSRGGYQGMEMIDMSHAVLSDTIFFFFCLKTAPAWDLRGFFVLLGSKAQLWAHSWRLHWNIATAEAVLSTTAHLQAACRKWFQINPESCSECSHENL